MGGDDSVSFFSFFLGLWLIMMCRIRTTRHVHPVNLLEASLELGTAR
jgi:hypothetical protein